MTAARVLGRYALYDEIAHGGMATVHLGRHIGAVGFSRTVAIKRLHPQFAKDPDFVSMFLDEARLAARIRHPNVVPTLDVVSEEDELFLVMEYVTGESLSRLLRVVRTKGATVPLNVLSAVFAGALNGLHAAHEATSENGEPLGIVHRDVSPQNILVGVDGVPRVLDFGIAMAAGRLQTTKEGQLKGKLAYMPPEQVQGAVTRRTDVYAIAVCFWEALTGERLFHDDNPAKVLSNLLNKDVAAPSECDDRVSPALDALVLKGLARDPRERFATAREMARELEKVVAPASASDVGDWVESVVGDDLGKRARTIADIESDSFKRAPSDVPIDIQPLRASAEAITRVGPVTEQSSVSLATPPRELVVARRSHALTLALFAIAGLLGVVVFLMMRSPPPPSPTAEASTPSTPPSAVSVPSSAAPLPSATSTAALPPSPSPSASASASVSPPKLKPKAVKSTNCNPPFEYDSNGKKRYKPECF